MTWGMVAVAGATLVGSYMGSQSQKDAANTAAGAQQASAQAGIDEQRRQFDAIQKLLSPYVSAGTGALGQQQALIGLSGPQAQQQAIDAIQNGPQFKAMLQQGQNSILANASATGGLRGGNTQAALAQFSPQLLTQLIQQQFGNLGGLTSVGQNAAAGVGNAGMQTGNSITNLLQQQGAASAGAALAGGRASMGAWSGGMGALGTFAGGGGFNNLGTYFGGSGGGGGLGIDQFGQLGGPGTAGDFSDARLKHDLEPLGRDSNGLMLYAFRYVWGGARRLGYLAQEVAEKFPAAVHLHASGFLTVDYAEV